MHESKNAFSIFIPSFHIAVNTQNGETATYLADLSWSLKRVFLIAYCLLFVRLLTFHIFIFSSRFSRSISTKHGTKHFFGERDSTSSRRDNDGRVKKLMVKCKKNFSLRQFQPNWTQSFLGWRKLIFVQRKGHALLQEEIITEQQKYIDGLKKSSRELLAQFQPTLKIKKNCKIIWN